MVRAMFGMSIDQLDPDRFREHESAIREALSDLPVKFEGWHFREAECRLNIALTYQESDEIDATVISNRIDGSFWVLPVFRPKQDVRGIEAPLLNRMTWRDDPHVLRGFTSLDLPDGKYHDVDFELHIKELDATIEDTFVIVRRFLVAWSDHDRQIKRSVAATRNSTSNVDQSQPFEGVLPSHMTFFVDSSVAVRYPAGDWCVGKDVLAKLSPEGAVLLIEQVEPQQKEESKQRAQQLFLNFPGISQTRFKSVEEELVSRLERELQCDSLRASCHGGKSGLVVWVSCEDRAEVDSIEEQVQAIVDSFDLIDANDPNVIQDGDLGTWFWDDRLKRWETDVHFVDEEQQPILDIDLAMPAKTKEDDISAQLQTMKRFLDDLEDYWEPIHAAISDKLLEIYNSNWNDGAPKTQAEFLDEICIASLQCESDGSMSCCFTPGTLFTDHVIEVYISPTGEVQSVSLAG